MRVFTTGVAALGLLLVASGCGHRNTGAYYQHDGPPAASSVDVAAIPDAVPQSEPHARTGNKSYVALGKRYTPLTSARGFKQTGRASWYGRQFHGRATSSGEPYDMYGMTAAHPTLPLPTYVQVTRVDTGRSVVVKVNDRGPFLGGRILDLSYAAAAKLGIVEQGTGEVRVVAITEFGAQGNASQPLSGDRQPFVIQAGAFGRLHNAIVMQQRLLQLGHSHVSVLKTGQGDTTLYRVRVGPIAGYDAASRHAQTLAQTLGTRPRIVAAGD